MAMNKAYKRLGAAGSFLRNAIVRNISKPTRTFGPSRPGQFPHADTGTLKKSIFWKYINEREVIVGSNLDYSLWLETGTRMMAARPYIRRTFKQVYSTLRSILNGN
jgi:phage gpG-like protein